MRRPLAIGLVAAALPFAPVQASAQSSCGAATTVEAGETLADVAERCDVGLGALFDANPQLRTTDLPAGTKVDVPSVSPDSVLDRAGDVLREAGREIENAATRAGKSVSEYLSDNPDLNRDVLEWGEWLGLPGVAPEPVAGADVSVRPDTGRPGGEVTVSAAGLPGDAEVRIGAGPPNSEYEMLERARTTREGRVEATIAIPQWAGEHDALVFVVETDRVRLVSEPFEIVADR